MVFDIELVISIIFGDYVHLFSLCVGAFEKIYCGSASATPMKAYLIFKVIDLDAKDYHLRNRKIQRWESQRRDDPS